MSIATLVSKVVKTISLHKVALWAFTVLLGIVMWTAYENRASISALFSPTKAINPVGLTFTVGSTTQAKLKAAVNSDKDIIGIVISSADLRLNEAKTIFFVSTDEAINEMHRESQRAARDRLPLFTSDDTNNAEVVKLINGQFSCMPFEKALISRFNPGLASSVKQVCRSSIPSYYGYFSGFVTAYLSVNPSAEEMLQLKSKIEKLANDIYFQDVLTTQRTDKDRVIPTHPGE